MDFEIVSKISDIVIIIGGSRIVSLSFCNSNSAE